MTNNQYAFLQGYEVGAQRGELSRHEAEVAFPNFTLEQVDYACSGSIDGALGDLWRVNLILRSGSR